MTSDVQGLHAHIAKLERRLLEHDEALDTLTSSITALTNQLANQFDMIERIERRLRKLNRLNT